MSLGGAFRVFLSELGAVGLDPAAVCTAAGVDPRALHDGVPLGLDALTRILERAEAMAGDVSLGMSGKTLARRLATEGRQFRDVVDGIRRVMAQRLLGQELDLAEVAGQIGFADPGAFGKAFRRWFGEPPSVFRARRKG
jgi:hypothetical protein